MYVLCTPALMHSSSVSWFWFPLFEMNPALIFIRKCFFVCLFVSVKTVPSGRGDINVVSMFLPYLTIKRQHFSQLARLIATVFALFCLLTLLLVALVVNTGTSSQQKAPRLVAATGGAKRRCEDQRTDVCPEHARHSQKSISLLLAHPRLSVIPATARCGQ